MRKFSAFGNLEGSYFCQSGRTVFYKKNTVEVRFLPIRKSSNPKTQFLPIRVGSILPNGKVHILPIRKSSILAIPEVLEFCQSSSVLFLPIKKGHCFLIRKILFYQIEGVSFRKGHKLPIQRVLFLAICKGQKFANPE